MYPSDDPLDRLIYEVYENHHVPIFYNDTIGREKKVDRFGQEWVSYEILDPNYTIESVMASVKYVLSRDREKLKTGVEFLCDGVLERLPEIVQPKCFLLVDSVYLRGAGSVSSVSYTHLLPWLMMNFLITIKLVFITFMCTMW